MADRAEMPDDWSRALVLMAHPDDPEYGVAAAVAEWTSRGKDVRYVLATRGEAGIAGTPPAVAAGLRTEEQRAAISHVGVSELEFLDYPDGRLESGLALRRDIAAAIRRHQPELVVTLSYDDTFEGLYWNSADHRAMGISVMDAVADAANEWIFPELSSARLSPWQGVKYVALAGTAPTHYVALRQESVDAAIASLAEHREYLKALSPEPVAEQARAVVGGSVNAGRIELRVFGA
ncbi:PIG-L deacetylase family protein [Saxibacter everestensis]|uniref:PIG-L deacetylase family protein n=1 Tax=Saxibacter everestensis TaxID=2909229 RepID=A0ABY8QXZ4_9MICO|nr:PIG-L deacetylase family protein [Brevibacteriaceae bacterium ZFBP1038]